MTFLPVVREGILGAIKHKLSETSFEQVLRMIEEENPLVAKFLDEMAKSSNDPKETAIAMYYLLWWQSQVNGVKSLRY
ncbi:MAG: hypothetical protein Q8P71_00755 [bacterium]|nr:hypothetical protein [bacterium]